ncbi:GGDEF domain-containing protein [Motiliproteus coralliicola]|uniref:diguanylate cyclase n=1 Tax=Motiliproteus coralliicola TaxID=2283196 RepID=A0A369WE95_9GAMM|nr:GGDEF domain-containing protein [Motiliproteus coralliicola]RDE19014.1 GGDEF domain-containing protein [Motiliproteus coralliicola]
MASQVSHLPDTTAPVPVLEQELERRSLNGVYVYLVAWAIIGWAGHLLHEEPGLFWGVLLVLTGLGCVRLLSYHYSNRLLAYRPRVWHWIFGFNALAPAAIYGGLMALEMLHSDHDEHEHAFTYLLMVVFALISGGIVTFSPKRALANAYLLVITVPAILTAILTDAEHLHEGLLIFLYGAFTYMHIKLLNGEYQERCEQRGMLEKLTQMDTLTDIYNRRYFDDALNLYWKSHLRNGKSLALLLIDIDHFKQINDRYGHPTGDKVIQQVANTLKNSFRRDTDIVARIGGEEFAVLMSEPSLAVVEQLADGVNLQISRQSIDSAGERIQVTVSIGVALLTPELNCRSRELYKVADRCLYQAKEQGRNRVVVVAPLAAEADSA